MNLNDFPGLAEGSIEYHVFYMKSEHFRDGIMGHGFCEEQGCLPDPDHLERTHIKLGVIRADSAEQVFAKMQGENWSPKGEANQFIQEKGLRHTSMSVGDVLWDADTGDYFLVDNVGMKPLISQAEAMTRKLGRRHFSIVIEDHEGEHSSTFSVKEMASTITEAGKSLRGIETPDQLVKQFCDVRGLTSTHWSEVGRVS